MQDNTVIEQEVVMSPVKQLLLSTELPAQSRTYKPVPHRQLIDVTLESIDRCGFILDSEMYSAAADGKKANGKYHLSYGNDPEMGLMVAWQNSYDKSMSLKLGVGSHVFICSNGLIVGDVGTYKSKHVGQVQQITPEAIREYICRAGENFEQMIAEKAKLKEIELSKRITAELLGRLLIEDACITSTQLNIIRRELKEPSYDYQAPGTAWELLNHITHAHKDCSPLTWMKQSADTHQFFVNEFQLV